MSATLHLTEHLIGRASVTPEDGGCLQLLGQRVWRHWASSARRMDSGPADFRVTNLWAKFTGTAKRGLAHLVFAGHTDVVPTGPLAQWTSAPSYPATGTDNSTAAAPPT
jgi:succinyl-diaminopimelate desuccinylase